MPHETLQIQGPGSNPFPSLSLSLSLNNYHSKLLMVRDALAPLLQKERGPPLPPSIPRNRSNVSYHGSHQRPIFSPDMKARASGGMPRPPCALRSLSPSPAIQQSHGKRAERTAKSRANVRDMQITVTNGETTNSRAHRSFLVCLCQDTMTDVSASGSPKTIAASNTM